MDCSIHPVNRHQATINMNCDLKTPITDMFLTMILETKNSKNIYSVWANQTVDYCGKIGEGNHVSLMGALELIINKYAPGVLRSCPITGYWGVSNLTLSSSILNGYPIWAFPTKQGRCSVTAFTKSNVLIGEFHGIMEVKVLGA